MTKEELIRHRSRAKKKSLQAAVKFWYGHNSLATKTYIRYQVYIHNIIVLVHVEFTLGLGLSMKISKRRERSQKRTHVMLHISLHQRAIKQFLCRNQIILRGFTDTIRRKRFTTIF